MISSCARTSKRYGTRLRAVAVWLALLILVTSSPTYSTASGPANVPTTETVLDTVVRYTLELEADVWELQQLARLDSLRHAIEIESYQDRLKEARGTWYERIIKHPVVWVTIGMYVGIVASR